MEATPQELAEFKRHVSAQYLYAERMLTSILSKVTIDDPCVMIDVDGTIIHPLKLNGIRDVLPGIKKFVKHCQKLKVDIYFLTFRKESGREQTEKLLQRYGLMPYKDLIMHTNEEVNTVDFKLRKMKEIRQTIVMCIGDNVTDLAIHTCNVLISNPWSFVNRR